MKTYLSRFFVAASSVLATALTTTAVAQTADSRAPRPMVRPNVANLLPLTGAEAKTSPREQAERLAQLRANRPLLFKARVAGQAVAGQLKPVKRAVPAKADAAPFYVSKAAASVPLGRELWANVMQSGRWADSDPDYGMYSFGVSGKMEMNEKYVDARMYANAGGALSGDRLDIVKYDSSVGTMTHYCFDAETGDLKSSDYLSDYSLWATETAVAADGTVYGDFFTGDASSYELGIADYANNTRSTIGSLHNYYVALGITKDNVLYGISTYGDLYRIDTKTAKESLVGSTGVKLMLSDGSWNVQSGEIDHESGIFYWACTDHTGASALYTVDLASGAATKVGDIVNNEQLALLSIPKETVADAAPGMTADLAVGLDKASLAGNLTFTVPTTTYRGSQLTGEVSYVVSVDGKSVATGKASAGAAVSEKFTVKRGNRLFSVVLSNAAGNGPKAYKTVFVGDDTPCKPTNVKASLDIATGKLSLSWDAVTKGINNGYVGDVTYDVVRYPDNMTLASATTNTSLTDQLPGGNLTGYYYTVTARSGQRKSDVAQSNSVSYGDMLEPPYHQDFDNEAALNLFTIIDANEDGATWKFCENDGTGQSSAQIEYGDSEDGHDDWLIMPPLKLKKGQVYNVSFRAASMGESFPEELEVMYGSEPTAEAMTHTLMAKTKISNVEYETLKAELTPDKDGAFYIGFHCTTDGYNFYKLVLDDISVKGNSQKAPDAATNLRVVPAEDGSAKATFYFTAPTKAIDGTKLTSDLDVYIMRDGEEIQQMAAVKPGSEQYYIDNWAQNGVNTYSVIASNDEGTGRESQKVSAYVGKDTPASPTGIKATTTDNDITLTWDPVTKGTNGGYIDPNDVVYNVYEIIETGTGVSLPLVDQVSATTITIPYDTNDGEQEMINYALSAENSVDEGPRVMSPGIIVGTPYTLPFEEHFKGGRLDNAMWWTDQTGEVGFDLMQGMSSEGDGGCSGYIAEADSDKAKIGVGKIALNGAENPMLVFSYMSTAAKEQTNIELYVKTPGKDDVLYKTFKCGGEGSSAWTTMSVPLDKNLASQKYVMLTFIVQTPAGTALYIDNVCVRDVAGKDLRASMTAPEKVRRGENVTAKVMVENVGSVAARSYAVRLYTDGKLADTKDINETLEPNGRRTVELTYKSSVVDKSPLALKAEVAIDEDATPDDNIVEATVELTASTRTAPESVDATTADGKVVSVTWKKVEEKSETVTDDFESYTPWAMDDFGEWTSVYGEKGIAKGPFSRTYPHPVEGKRFAYTLVEPSSWIVNSLLDQNPCLKPRSGKAYLASFYSVEDSKFIPADNWLISPPLTERKQTVSFWANNFKNANLGYSEDFEVLYSTAGTAIADFKTTVLKAKAEAGEWKQYTVDLPQGATFFAIHNNTADTYMFMVDDVTYEAGTGVVKAYNVYRDGVFLAQVKADAAAEYTDTQADGGRHRYAVSAVYVGGESEATQAPVVTAVDALPATETQQTYDVYTPDGKVMARGAKKLGGLPKGVYKVKKQSKLR